jgi:CRP-like cAMP-binding protein
VTTARPTLHRRNRLLTALSPAEFSLLAPHIKEVPLEPRELLHETHDEIEHVYFPNGGMVSLLAITEDGEAIETAAVGYEGVIGAVVGLGIRHAFTRAVVQVPGSASRIPSAQFQKLAGESHGLRDLIVRHNESLLVQAQQTAACGALHGVEARLARWLLQTQDRTGSETIPLIQEFLAQVLGVRRTTINLVVRTLHQAGIVRYRRGQIEIINRHRLRGESCSCYNVIRKQVDRLLAPAVD